MCCVSGRPAIAVTAIGQALQLCRPEAARPPRPPALWGSTRGRGEQTKQGTDKLLPSSHFPVSPQCLPLAEPKQRVADQGGWELSCAGFHTPGSIKENPRGQEWR